MLNDPPPGLNLHIYADGASRGNPGPAAAGAVLKDERGNKMAEVSLFLGTATNNQAEYRALIAALEAATKLKPKSVHIHLDSQLVVLQVLGTYQMKNPRLRPLLQRAQQLMSQFKTVEIDHIPGSCNHEAHLLAGAAFRQKKRHP